MRDVSPENHAMLVRMTSLGRLAQAEDVAHCCHAWNRLIDQPWRILSIGMRDWAHRF